MRSDPTSLPKYVQTSEMLIREISAGRLLDGERLPPEREMAQSLGIAVGTLRKALDELESRGLVKRIHGSGNYISHTSGASGVYAFFKLERKEGGGLPTAEVIDVKKLPKPATLPNFGKSPDAHRIRRLRRLSGEAVAIEEIWLDGAWADTLVAHKLSESLYLFYRQSLGLWISKVEDSVGVSNIPVWAPSSFDLEPGVVSGHVERKGWDANGEIAELSKTWFDFEKCRYVSRMK